MAKKHNFEDLSKFTTSNGGAIDAPVISFRFFPNDFCRLDRMTNMFMALNAARLYNNEKFAVIITIEITQVTQQMY